MEDNLNIIKIGIMIYSLLLQITETVADSTQKINEAVIPAVVATPAQEATFSIWDLLVKGGVVMIPITMLSILAVYIFFERLLAIKKSAKMDHNFMNNIKDFVCEGRLDAAKNFCNTTNTPSARMIAKGIARIGRPISEIERTLESIGKFEVLKLEKNLKILGIVAGIAPMLGFIGTIMGVIKIFYNISLTDNISIGIIAGGLYEKMITSASGLIIGVLAFAGYHYLSILLDKVVFQMENNGIDFIDILQNEA